jgi:putative addiction module component (TIGR02574 family)
MNAMLMKELSKLSIEERRALIDDLWDSIDSELDAAPISEEVGKLLDERAAALARDPKQKKYTLQEIAARQATYVGSTFDLFDIGSTFRSWLLRS